MQSSLLRLSTRAVLPPLAASKPSRQQVVGVVRQRAGAITWLSPFASLLLNAGQARAEEGDVQQALTSALPSLPSLPDKLDLSEGFPDGVDVPDFEGAIEAMQSNPVLAVGAVLAIVVGTVLAIAAASSSGKQGGGLPTAAAQALEALGSEPRTVLVDIRPKALVKEQGVPDLKAVKKKLLSLPFNPVAPAKSVEEGGDLPDAVWASLFGKLSGIDEDSVVILIDSDGSEAAQAARALEGSDLELGKVYYVRGGFEGTKGWKESELPWKESRAFELPELPKFDGASLDKIADLYKANPSALNATLALGALVGAGIFVATEIEVLVEVVGTLLAGQLIFKRLLFAEDRKKTINSFNSLLTGQQESGSSKAEVQAMAQKIGDSKDSVDTAIAAQVKSTSSVAKGSANSADASTVPEAPMAAESMAFEAAEARR